MGYLAEVAEEEARGSVAAAYADIRATVGLPVVNLVYRHLATVPGRLEDLWARIVPALREPAARRIANEVSASMPVPGVEPIPGASLAAAGIDAATLGAVEAILDTYARGNATNLIVLTALLDGVEGTAAPLPPAPLPPAPAVASSGKPADALPAMVPPERLPGMSRLLVEEMSAVVTGQVRPLLIPSLFRHLTHPAALLPLAWTVLRRPLTSPEFEPRARALAAAARAAVPGLAFGVPRVSDRDARAALGRFVQAIPRMLLVGAMLRAALAEGLPRPETA